MNDFSWQELLAFGLFIALMFHGWPTFLTIHKHYHIKHYHIKHYHKPDKIEAIKLSDLCICGTSQEFEGPPCSAAVHRVADQVAVDRKSSTKTKNHNFCGS